MIELFFDKTNFGFFSQNEIHSLQSRITTKTSEKTSKQTYYVKCIIREKEIVLKPEEIVRQLYTQKLLDEYGYDKSQIKFEYTVTFGREKKSADIVVFQKNHPTEPYIIIELKKPKQTTLKDGKDQLKSYTNATGAPMAVWSDGLQTNCYHRKDPNYFEPIDDIPKANETLEDILNERWTIADLVDKDILVKGKKSLKDLILDLEDEVLANAGVDVFEELFKLIFAKLYDEMLGGRDKTYILQFRNSGQSDFDLKDKLEKLFQNAKNKWNGVFSDESKITLTPSHLAICVATLQNAKLFNSNLEVVDEAFEYLINKSSKGEKGQYFTPRYVIDMCVKMLNPQPNETMIDTAAGSCGFPVHTIFHVWEQILQEKGIEKSHLFTAEEKPVECAEYVQNNVFAIDFDEKAVRVARTLNLIAGDGQTNVLHLNTLDFSRWDNQTDQRSWTDNYNDGWRRIRKLQRYEKSYQHFDFDILMANPPFAGDIKEGQLLAQYELGKNAKGKNQTKVGRDILFIERNTNFLKPGGRMAIVLPQGRFNNSSDAHIRNFLAERGRILAVVGLHGNVFKPHTGTKTSVLLWQKWTDEKGINPKKEDYPIFFATMQKPSKDNSGKKIYVKTTDGTNLLDQHSHLIVDHDLFNHEGKTQDGIFEAFREFAKREHLSFFFEELEAFNEKRYTELLASLEVSEVRLAEMVNAGRMDAEYYKKEYSYFFSKIINFNFLSDFVKEGYRVVYETTKTFQIENGEHPYFIQATDIETPLINTNKLHQVDKSDWYRYPKGRIQKGEILIEVKGMLEKVAIVTDDCDEYSLVSGSLFKLTVNEKINKNTLLIYLISKYGKTFKERYKTNLMVSYISKPDLYRIPVPNFSAKFQNNISTIFDKSIIQLTQSKSLYSEAETLLLQELDLENYQEDTQNIAEVALSQMLKVGRMDAEYFQPKYAKFIEHLQNYKNGCATFANVIQLHTANIQPKSKINYKYIELSNIGNHGEITDHTTELGENLPSRARYKVQENQVILSSIEGSLSSIALITEKYNEAFCSTGFYPISSKTINPETLLIFFKTIAGQTQLKRGCNGTILTAINKDELLQTIIPLIPKTLQNQIAQKVQESHALRKESKRLLEVAKKAVEIAIEQDEARAMAFLRRKS